MDNHTSFKKKHTLQERIEKSKKQMQANPDKIVIIVEKHPKSTLPTLSNPRYLRMITQVPLRKRLQIYDDQKYA